MMKKRSDVPRRFFSSSEHKRIVAAIGEAERQTSGEIRFHVERDVPTGLPVEGDAYRRARVVFAELGMHATAARNGVLIFMAVRSRRFAVIGDEELHLRVGEGFWEDVVDVMSAAFAEDRFGDGLCDGITLIGEKLRTHFPYSEHDINELSDDISFS